MHRQVHDLTVIGIAAVVIACTGQEAPAASPSAVATSSNVPTGSPSPAPTATGAPTPTASARAPLPEGEAWIAYQAITSERHGAHAVHLVRPDGTGDFFALDMVPGGEQKHPDWSPDGRRLVLDVSDSTDTLDIWVADLTSWSAYKLVDCAAPCLWAQEPAWSHDGTRIAYQRHTDTEAGEISTIEIIEVASGSTTVAYQTASDKGIFAPRWSPDDTSLVFEQTASKGDAILGVSLEAFSFAEPSATRTIVPVDRFANNADWSPDGRLIAFSAPIAGGEPGGALSDIWVVKPGGTEPSRVTDVAASGGSAVQPTLTPDGKWIIFKLSDGRVGASDAIALVAVAGGDPEPATRSNYLYGWHPRLRPVP